MSALGKTLSLVIIMLAIGVGLVIWKSKHPSENHGGGVTKLTKENMELLLKDENPMMVKQIADDPEGKKKYTDNQKEFFAVANEARKEGLADDPKNKIFLDYVRAQIVALAYDEEKNKDKGNLQPFSFVKKEDVDAFYQKPENESGFQKFVQTIIAQGKEESPDAPEPTPEQIEDLKGRYAKVKISEKLYDDEKETLSEEFKKRTEFQVQFQQANLLNQLYAQKVLRKKVEPNEEQIKAYVASHPEYNAEAKKAKAEDVLKRAKAGEDFAALANEFSEDPGNTDQKTNEKKGGLYPNVKPGSGFDKKFEETALSLQPGQIADTLIETPFGYHIIRLERKGPGKDKDGKSLGETYDVRHILFMTSYRNPRNPFSPPMTLIDKAKADLTQENIKKTLEEIVAKNPIEVEDFTITPPSDEEMQRMMMEQMQRQMPQGPPPGGDDEEEDSEKTTPKSAPRKK